MMVPALTGPTPNTLVKVVLEALTAAVSFLLTSRSWASRRRMPARSSGGRKHRHAGLPGRIAQVEPKEQGEQGQRPGQPEHDQPEASAMLHERVAVTRAVGAVRTGDCRYLTQQLWRNARATAFRGTCWVNRWRLQAEPIR